MSYLYENFDTLSKFGAIPNKRFALIDDNLSNKFPIRDYQIKAFSRFDYFINRDFEGKPKKPYHLLNNMATGSGKTLVMAGLMLYLYEKGYRNFLFFVNSNNIIRKTKDNFLNQQASKYLFNEKIVVNGDQVYIKETETFDSADDKNINIKFTTIQQLHIDLNNTKENSVTYDDFIDKKIVLIADEAHHLNADTRRGADLFEGWESTVLKILKQNDNNMLLEFTATLDFGNQEIAKKYEDKVIYKYDLSQFRQDKYSKEINLVRSEFDEKGRIVQALLLNLYRQEIAAQNIINLKPVILFKAKKTIKESEQNKINFHQLIDEMNGKLIDKYRKASQVDIIKKAFLYFDSKNITSTDIANRLKSYFKQENCISANDDKEAEANQIRLNTLEDENNPIRAIFAVQKLNEGWDVLNLFDIVRLYEGRDGEDNKPGKTTIAEAQLIGRGARYFPFSLDASQDKFTRKYDDELSKDLKIIEELHYHTKEDSRYVSELKKALVQTGIYVDEDDLIEKQLTLKLDFKETDFYKSGHVAYNKRIPKTYGSVKSFADLGVTKVNIQHTLSSGVGKTSGVFNTELEASDTAFKSQDIKLNEIPSHVIRHALNLNPFFYFNSLEKYFPSLGSISNFIKSSDYLGSLAITFKGSQSRLDLISHEDYLLAITNLLQEIEQDIKSNVTAYEGSDFTYEYVHKIFKDKTIKVERGSERSNGQESLLISEPWYAYNANYGTSEEKAFVAMFARRFASLKKKYEHIFLLRNERELKIFDKSGRAFEPDFILFCRQKNAKKVTYQVFIEPKGGHLIANDKWKEDFLISLGKKPEAIKIQTDSYLITGVPFYNYENENEFSRILEERLEVSAK